jgi:hypothetical protein
MKAWGKIKIKCRRKYLKIWDGEVKGIIEDKQKADKKWLHSGNIVDNIECK